MRTLFHHGVVRTVTQGVVDSVLVEGNRILAVGRGDTLAAHVSGVVRRIDLAGRTLVPGFNDAHAHIWKIGHLLVSMLDLRGCPSLRVMNRRLMERDRSLAKDSWLVGRGLNEGILEERRLPTRADFDEIVPHRPVAITRACGHMYLANSMALHCAGISSQTPDPAGGRIDRDEHGEPTGILRETAMGLLSAAIPKATASEYEAMVTAAMKHQLSLGITSTSDCGVLPDLLQVYRSMEQRAVLPSRINVMPLRKPDGSDVALPLPQREVGRRLRVDTVKFLADGGLSGATAALSVRYRHADNEGVLRFTEEELHKLCAESQNAGWRIATHAIGDRTIDQVIDVYERLSMLPSAGLRHRIEHLGLPTNEHLRRAAAIGVIAVPQAIFLRELGANFRAFVPDALSGQIYPLRSMWDAGMTVALSSDAPVVFDDAPLSGMQTAMQRLDATGICILPEQALSAEEALFGYTMAGAISTGAENDLGSIEAGKLADLAILSADPVTVDPSKLDRIRVDMTILDGDIAYER